MVVQFLMSPPVQFRMSFDTRGMGRDSKTVRKYIERGIEAPVYGPRSVGRPSKLAPFMEFLLERIVAFPDLSAARLTSEVREPGYGGPYTAAKRFLAAIRRENGPKPYEVLFETPPGPQAQVDFRPLRGGLHRRRQTACKRDCAPALKISHAESHQLQNRRVTDTLSCLVNFVTCLQPTPLPHTVCETFCCERRPRVECLDRRLDMHSCGPSKPFDKMFSSAPNRRFGSWFIEPPLFIQPSPRIAPLPVRRFCFDVLAHAAKQLVCRCLLARFSIRDGGGPLGRPCVDILPTNHQNHRARARVWRSR